LIFAVCQQYPALKRDLPALSCEFQRYFNKRDTATSWKQEQ
jgi:hypothetical protein